MCARTLAVAHLLPVALHRVGCNGHNGRPPIWPVPLPDLLSGLPPQTTRPRTRSLYTQMQASKHTNTCSRSAMANTQRLLTPHQCKHTNDCSRSATASTPTIAHAAPSTVTMPTPPQQRIRAFERAKFRANRCGKGTSRLIPPAA